jgi:hypothetical protein
MPLSPPMIHIDRLEREIEFRLPRGMRLVLRALVAVLTNAVLALMVLASIRAFGILADYLVGRELTFFGGVSFRSVSNVLDAMTIIIFTISALARLVRMLTDEAA